MGRFVSEEDLARQPVKLPMGRFIPEEDFSPKKPPKGGSTRAFFEGAARAGTFGYADEIAAKTRSLVLGTKYEDELEKVRGTTEELTRAHPVASTSGQIFGSFAAPGGPIGLGGKAVSTALKALPATKAVGGAAALGAATGGLTASGESQEGDRLGNVPMGMLLGGAGGALGEKFGRIVSPTKKQITPAVKAAQELKIPVSPSKASGLRTLGHVEERLLGTPIVGGPLQARTELAQGRYNEIARKAMGGSQGTGPIFREEIDNIAANIGEKIENFTKMSAVIPKSGEVRKAASKIAFDESLLAPSLRDNELATIAKDTALMFSRPKDIRLSQTITKDMARLIAKPIDTSRAQQILSRLATIRRQSTPERAQKIGMLENSILNSVEKALPADVTKAWKEARKQWRAYRQIDDALDPSTGNIVPEKLKSVMARRSNRREKGTLVRKMANAAPLMTIQKGSQTAEKLATEKLGQSVLVALGLAGGGYAVGTGEVEPLTLATSLLGGYGASRFLASPLGVRWAMGSAPVKARISPVPMGILGGMMAGGL